MSSGVRRIPRWTCRTAVDEVRVGEHHALGQAAGAARVRQQRDRVRAARSAAARRRPPRSAPGRCPRGHAAARRRSRSVWRSTSAAVGRHRTPVTAPPRRMAPSAIPAHGGTLGACSASTSPGAEAAAASVRRHAVRPLEQRRVGDLAPVAPSTTRRGRHARRRRADQLVERGPADLDRLVVARPRHGLLVDTCQTYTSVLHVSNDTRDPDPRDGLALGPRARAWPP